MPFVGSLVGSFTGVVSGSQAMVGPESGGGGRASEVKVISFVTVMRSLYRSARSGCLALSCW